MTTIQTLFGTFDEKHNKISNYFYLGRLPQETIDFLLVETLKLKNNELKEKQWIYYNYYLNFEFLKLFTNKNLELKFIKEGAGLQKGVSNFYNQKVFYTPAGQSFMIHKDGINDKVALNIALSCNEDDWVRWYDEESILQYGEVPVTVSKGYSRNAFNVPDFENFPYIEEIKNKIGDVYVIRTDVFHSYKCVGPKDRLILQTKFEGNPSFETVCDLLSNENFKNLIKKK
jgi:hypothetical protein